MDEFTGWVKDQGGGDEFVSILKEFGFNSKLSLSNLDLQDAQELLEKLNCGQRCLLRGLIELAGAPGSSYSGCVSKLDKVRKKTTDVPAMRSKINQLFNFDSKSSRSLSASAGPSTLEPDENFLPTPSFRPLPPSKRRKSGKGKDTPGKSVPMKKVKEVRFKVVGLPWRKASVPVGEERERCQKILWLRECASEIMIKNKIKELFNWRKCDVEFMYASGRHLRPATLDDVENATSWEFSTVRALVGNGCLYVTKIATISSSDSEEEEKPTGKDKVKTSYGIDKVEALKQVFSHIPSKIVEETLESQCFDDAVDMLTTMEDSKPDDSETSASLLKCHADKVIDFSASTFLEVDRKSKDVLWNCCVAFYKSCSSKPEKLRKELMVKYVDEQGCDSGSLRLEFFEDAIHEANLNLLEGEDECRIIKKDWGMESQYEMFGMLVAHSLLLNGPGLKCLCPTIYDYLTKQTYYPEVADIPLSLGTHDLISLIKELDNASNTDELDSIIDEPTNLSIINASGWSPIEPVTHANRYRLIECLITEEVICKREKNMQAFFRGLNSLQLGDLIVANPKKFKTTFMFEHVALTAESFMNLVASLKPPLPEKAQAFEYFREYVCYIADNGKKRVSLPGLLRFITGCSRVPPMGLKHPIEIDYLPNEEKMKFPNTKACFSKIALPVCHQSQEAFSQAMSKALEFCCDYGSV